MKYLLLLLVIISFATTIQQTFGQEELTILPLSNNPYNFNYSELTTRWFDWLQSIPSDENPASDLDGRYCNLGQNHSDFFWLTGVFEGSADRTCEISLEEHQFAAFPHGYECSTAEYPQLQTYEELSKCATENLDLIVDPQSFIVTIDGHTFNNLSAYRFKSPPFEVELPPNNIWGVQEGKTLEAADTYFVPIKLTQGNHTLEVSTTSSPTPGTTTEPTHAFSVRYNLIVK